MKFEPEFFPHIQDQTLRSFLEMTSIPSCEYIIKYADQIDLEFDTMLDKGEIDINSSMYKNVLIEKIFKSIEAKSWDVAYSRIREYFKL